MRRSTCTAALATLLILALHPAAARAESASHDPIGLGFHNTIAPIGVRWWLAGQKVGVDAGFGFSSEPAPLYSDEKLSSWAIELGVPLVMHSWDRAHILFRPGFIYQSQQELASAPPAPFSTDDATTFDLAAEIEAEVFLVDNISVSASHGIAYTNFNPAGPGSSVSSFTTIGQNFTTVGFHMYFLGGTNR